LKEIQGALLVKVLPCPWRNWITQSLRTEWMHVVAG